MVEKIATVPLVRAGAGGNPEVTVYENGNLMVWNGVSSYDINADLFNELDAIRTSALIIHAAMKKKKNDK